MNCEKIVLPRKKKNKKFGKVRLLVNVLCLFLPRKRSPFVGYCEGYGSERSMGYIDACQIFCIGTPFNIGLTLAISLVDFCLAAAASSGNSISATSKTGCSSVADPNCLKCNVEGCVKCPKLLILDERRCVDVCPSGYADQWSTNPELMGRICHSTGPSGAFLATVAGVAAGSVLCLSLVVAVFYIIKRKQRRKTIREKLINDNNIDRSDFLRQLDDMRPNAEYFLAMLNDARRQIRKLHLSGETSTANTYRPIVRDLAKILILLNRPIELVPTAPHDWNRLYAWAERALERYKPQVGQLIDFFQAPSDPRLDSSYQHSTFKSTRTTSTTDSSIEGGSSPQYHHHQKNQQMQLFGSLISLHEFEEPRSSDPFGSNFNNTLKSGTGSLLASDLHASSLWLEDEFFKLGFRPQDEITTEL